MIKNMNTPHTNKPTILLVEDDEKLSGLIRRYLEKNDFNVITELRGDTAIPRILESKPDLVVLDVMLPGVDGFEVCKQVRNDYQGTILMLTAKDEDIDQIVGLEIGADDYVVKPVEPRLLLARIRALLRRNANTSSNTNNAKNNNTHQESQARESLNTPITTPQQGKLTFGSLIIDYNSRSVTLHSKTIDLTSTEFDLLWLLASHAGTTLSRDVICRTVFNFEYNGLNRSVDNKISCLRKLLGDNITSPKGIKTIRGKGYLFVATAWENTHGLNKA